jgi:putative membrane protein
MLAAGGAVLLGALWLGPLPALAASRFSAHMLLHMGVVAVAAPLLALAISGTRRDPARRWPGVFNPVLASVAELLVVWGWHAPAFHHAARSSAAVMSVEQGSFLIAGVWLWMAACGGPDEGKRAWTGVAGLLFTSIHMTLLGAVFALAPRAMYPAAHSLDALADQHVGGAIMLLVGGASYLAGGLWLAWRGLHVSPIASRRPV